MFLFLGLGPEVDWDRMIDRLCSQVRAYNWINLFIGIVLCLYTMCINYNETQELNFSIYGI